MKFLEGFRGGDQSNLLGQCQFESIKINAPALPGDIRKTQQQKQCLHSQLQQQRQVYSVLPFLNMVLPIEI